MHNGASKIFLLISIGVLIFFPVLALAVGVGIMPQGGTFEPIKSTLLALDVECTLKFPADASTDNKAIGAAFDEYIKSKEPSSPIITEFASNKDMGMGEAFAKSGRDAGINPTIIVSMARKESQFATTGAAKNNPQLHNPFGRKKNASDYLTFSSYKDAILQHGAYLNRRYVTEEHAKSVLDIMKIYAPASDGNNPDGYAQDIATWSSEMVLLAKQNHNSALGSGACATNTVGQSGEIKLEVPAIKEKVSKSCNQIAIYMTALYYAKRYNKDASSITFPSYAPGTCSTDGLLVDELKQAGIDPNSFTVKRISHKLPQAADNTWNYITDALRNGNPTVMETKLYKENGVNQHWITVTGMSADGNLIYYNDPATGTAKSMAKNDEHWGDNGNLADSLIYVVWK